MRWHTVAARLAAGSASLALLGGCAAGATPSPTPSPSTAMVVPSASPSPSPLGTPSPAPSAAEAPTLDLAWHSIGSILDAVADRSVVGFASGYVAVERWSHSVWFSADERTWREISLPFKVTKDKYGRPMEARANCRDHERTQVLVVGGYTRKPCRAPEPPGSVSTGGGPECPLYPIA